MVTLAAIGFHLVGDALQWLVLLFRSTEAVRVENLFLRRQLALFIERGVRPRRVDAATRASLAVLARLFEWRDALMVVPPATLLRWHRAGWRLFWRLKSRPGRPPIPEELRALIRRMARENPLWGEERIADELLLKLSICISPRTVRKYLPKRLRGQPRGDLRWSTFPKNHATAILACDFFIAVTASFRMLYVFVVIEHSSRRLAHVNVTAHPSAHWTLQQLREAIGDADEHQYLIHDRDRIFAKHLDESIQALGVEVLRSPLASPKANAICERVIGTIRRECLDWMIPVSEAHLRSILREWVTHYNHGRPHSALGPDVPDPPTKPRRIRGQNPDIDCPRVRSCSPNPCWAGCTMSIHSKRCRWARSAYQATRRTAGPQDNRNGARNSGLSASSRRHFCGAQVLVGSARDC